MSLARQTLYDNVKYKVKKSGTTKGKWEIGDTFAIERTINYDNLFVRQTSLARKLGLCFP